MSFLSTLAICANYQNDVKKELLYCERMLTVDIKNPKILTNYAFALMRDKQYSKAKINLEECLNLGYKDFTVYNQLVSVCVYGFKDFNQAFSYIENIFDIYNGGQDLNDRNTFLLYNNYLSVAGLSGDKKLLDEIIEFKDSVKNISTDWYEKAEINEQINRGVFELNNNNLIEAEKYFTNIIQKKKEGRAIELVIFLNEICKVLQEYTKVQNLSDVQILYDFVKKIEPEKLFQDYKDIIENYFYLLNSFILLLQENKQIEDLDIRKDKLQEFYRLNLTTSEFIQKSFKLIKLIELYMQEYKNAIIKDNVKNEYEQKLKKLMDLPFDFNKETSFLYSLKEAENINDTLCILTIKTIKTLQEDEPTFIKNYKSKKISQLLETDFRDIYYYRFGLIYDVSSESPSRGGISDLKIKNLKFGTKIFEFKIWGRNDYKDVVKQIYSYLTDFEDDGFIFMVNENKSSIDDKYIENLKSENMGYISNSLERKEMNGFTMFISKHKIHVKTKKIYHFIYNLY